MWAQSAASELDGTQRAGTQTERIHQSRVAMRSIRSNLRTFRLLLDPTWGTSLRAELAWYGNVPGPGPGPPHPPRRWSPINGPEVIDPEQVARLDRSSTGG